MGSSTDSVYATISRPRCRNSARIFYEVVRDDHAFHGFRDQRGAGASQCRQTGARGKPAFHDDASGDAQLALAYRVSARWPHADHGENGWTLAGNAAGRKDAGHERAARAVAGTGRDAGRVYITQLRDRQESLSDLFRAG